MTLRRSALQSDIDLDSIRNSCDVLTKLQPFFTWEGGGGKLGLPSAQRYFWARICFRLFPIGRLIKSEYSWFLFLRSAALMDGWVNRIPWLAYDEKPDLLLWWRSFNNFQRINLTYFPRTHIPYIPNIVLQCIVLNWLTDSYLTMRLDCWPWQSVEHLAIYFC